jgi:hypothetical protein
MNMTTVAYFKESYFFNIDKNPGGRVHARTISLKSDPNPRSGGKLQRRASRRRVPFPGLSQHRAEYKCHRTPHHQDAKRKPSAAPLSHLSMSSLSTRPGMPSGTRGKLQPTVSDPNSCVSFGKYLCHRRSNLAGTFLVTSKQRWGSSGMSRRQ